MGREAPERVLVTAKFAQVEPIGGDAEQWSERTFANELAELHHGTGDTASNARPSTSGQRLERAPPVARPAASCKHSGFSTKTCLPASRGGRSPARNAWQTAWRSRSARCADSASASLSEGRGAHTVLLGLQPAQGPRDPCRRPAIAHQARRSSAPNSDPTHRRPTEPTDGVSGLRLAPSFKPRLCGARVRGQRRPLPRGTSRTSPPRRLCQRAAADAGPARLWRRLGLGPTSGRRGPSTGRRSLDDTQTSGPVPLLELGQVSEPPGPGTKRAGWGVPSTGGFGCRRSGCHRPADRRKSERGRAGDRAEVEI